MIYTLEELLKQNMTKYALRKQIEKGKIFKVAYNAYSKKDFVNEEEIILKKYTNSVITLNSAFYLYGLTDTIPDFYYLATPEDSKNITDSKIKQSYQNKKLLNVGKTKIDFNGSKIQTYDKERLLIELIRFNNKMPLAYYKEIIRCYRQISDSLDAMKIKEYSEHFAYGKSYFEKIMKEIF